MANPYLGSNISGCNSPSIGVDKATYTGVFDALAAALDAHDHTSSKGLQIPTAGIADLAVTAAKVAAGAIGSTQLSTAIAGAGLAGGGGTALSVNVDGTTLEINSDTLRVKAGGIGTSQLADAGVTIDKLGLGSVGSDQIRANNVLTAAIASSAVTTVKIADLAVTAAKLAAVVSLALAPVGAVIDFAGAVAPSGWLLCYGQAVSRTTYADLFSVISTIFGTGDGSTTFNLPDLRGRTTAGFDDMGGSAASRITNAGSGIAGGNVGAAGGSQNHTLTTAELPAHAHTVTDPGHAHPNGNDTWNTWNPTFAATPGRYGGTGSLLTPGTYPGTGTNTTGLTVDNTGGGTAHSVMQPTMIMAKIIKT